MKEKNGRAGRGAGMFCNAMSLHFPFFKCEMRMFCKIEMLHFPRFLHVKCENDVVFPLPVESGFVAV